MSTKMRAMLGGILLAAVAAGGAARAQTEPAADAGEKTITGEIVDPAAYLKDGRRGVEMTDQTYTAVDGGQTLALLEDGTENVYLFLAEEAGEDPNELAYDYVNQKVKVTGAVYERGGMRGIAATIIDPQTAAEPAAD